MNTNKASNPVKADRDFKSMPSSTVIWAREALKPQPPIPWIVDQLFSEGSLSIIFGEGGTYKTYSLLDCGVCVAMGKPWLGFEIVQRSVLFVDEESGTRRLNNRLAQVMRKHGADEGLQLGYTSLAQFNLRSIECIEYLDKLVRDLKIGLVIIDALADVMPGGDENSVKDVLPMFRDLRSLADNTKSAIVLIHHSNKAGGYRGSTSMKGAVDLMLELKVTEGNTFLSFTSEKARDVEQLSFFAKISFEDDQFSLTSTNKPPASKKLSETENRVLRFLAINGTSTTREITKGLGLRKSDSVRGATGSLSKPPWGYIIRTDSGGIGRMGSYYLTMAGREYVIQQGFSENPPPW